MSDIEIKRGYEVLPDNSVKFGIRIINNSNSAISDVEVLLDYTESLFNLEGNKIQKLGNIPPTIARTANFILKPLGCVHKENVGATVLYKDHKWEKHVESMHPKEVHCVCPFLKEMSITRSKFLELSTAGHSMEAGINFEGVTVDQLTTFLMQTCTNRLYKVDEYSIEGGRILYLASESIGEKAYYLLTAIIKENEGLTQVMLRAVSDKSHGLNGFMNEITADLRHVVNTVQSAHEIGVIRKEQVINIIDSVVQRTSFGGVGVSASVNIQDSVVQRTEFNAGEDRSVEEERLRKERERLKNERKEKENLEKLHRQKEQEEKKQLERESQIKQKARDEQERIIRQKSKTRTNVFMLAIVLGALLVGFVMFTSGSGDTHDVSTSAPSSNQKTRTNSIGMEFVLIPAGEFDMGSPPGEEGRYGNERPLHTVKIEKAYYLGKYEVTQKQWREVMGDNPSYFTGDDRPVETVSWNDIQEFIRKLNEKEGTNKYRLPSEAEWEYACRAGTTTMYSFGDSESRLDEYAWYGDNSGMEIHPVGQKKPNSWGLYDMHGNVEEWVQDEGYVNYDGAPTDGSAWDGGVGRVGSYGVHRGGSFGHDAWYCRSAFRGFSDGSGDRYASLGFRLLKEPDDTHDVSSPQAEIVPEPIESTSSTQIEDEPDVSLSSNQKTRTNSIGMEFVLIPAGEFDMGSVELVSEEARWDNEGPVHTVTIEKAYYLGKYEVTQKQWREVMEDNPSYFEGDDLPVETVSWNDAQEFIKKLNTKEDTDKYRLPSEAEWEYAARAGTTTRYSFGDSESRLGEYAWYGDNSGGEIHPVGQKKPNSWGLYDMHGNVEEWIQDLYHDYYKGAPTDGSAWDGGVDSFRVKRGGDWVYRAQNCRSADRSYGLPDERYRTLGFRLLQKL